MLEGPGPAGPGPIRQRPRAVRLGGVGAHLSRVIRLCLRFGVEPVFIPKGEPQFNGGVENFNGWFQPRLFQRRFARLGDLRRVGPVAAGGERATRPPAARRADAGPASPWTAALEVAPELRGADKAAAPVGGSRDLHPAGRSDRDGDGPEPIVPRGEEASGVLLAAGGGHRAGEADGVPEWARLMRWPYKLFND